MLRSLPVISARSDQTNERSCGLSQEENSHRELSLSPPLPPAGRRQGPHRIQVSHPIAFHALEEQRDGPRAQQGRRCSAASFPVTFPGIGFPAGTIDN